jgi:hypothetical protein
VFILALFFALPYNLARTGQAFMTRLFASRRNQKEQRPTFVRRCSLTTDELL